MVNAGAYNGFNLLCDIQAENTEFFSNLEWSLNSIKNLVQSDLDKSSHPSLLTNLLFANAITAMEVYLSDTLIKTVQRFPALIRRIVENEKQFSEATFHLSEIFRKHEKISDMAVEYLHNTLYHKLDQVRRLYGSVLSVKVQDDISYLIRCVNIRHGIVYRNGKAKDGQFHVISKDDILELINEIRHLTKPIDKQIRDIYIQMWNTDAVELSEDEE